MNTVKTIIISISIFVLSFVIFLFIFPTKKTDNIISDKTNYIYENVTSKYVDNISQKNLKKDIIKVLENYEKK